MMNDSDPLLLSFSKLKIDETESLYKAEGRTSCPRCNRSRKYYCYTCYCVMPRFKDVTPNVKLPLHIDIIKHRLEVDGKSTACHAAVISPEHVHIHPFPDFPDFDVKRTVLVFPGKDAIQLEDLVSSVSSPRVETSSVSSGNTSDSNKLTNGHTVLSEDQTPTSTPSANCDKPKRTSTCDTNNSCVRGETEHCTLNPQSSDTVDKVVPAAPFDRVIFIDATWNQVHGMLQDERLKVLKKVELRERHSRFWRHHKGSPPTFLSTIEAVYYFVLDYHNLFVRTPYEGQYDNLLFFFSHLCEKVTIAKDERINKR